MAQHYFSTLPQWGHPASTETSQMKLTKLPLIHCIPLMDAVNTRVNQFEFSKCILKCQKVHLRNNKKDCNWNYDNRKYGCGVADQHHCCKNGRHREQPLSYVLWHVRIQYVHVFWKSKKSVFNNFRLGIVDSLRVIKMGKYIFPKQSTCSWFVPVEWCRRSS